jgi:tetratricopeptide (TPR) repeat protein
MESAAKNSNAILRLLALATCLGTLPVHAQEGQPGQPAPAPASAADQGSAGAVGSALDYLFNRKPAEGSAAEQIGRSAGVLGDRALAQDATGVAGFNDPQVQARFAKYLSLKETDQARITVYRGLFDECLALLKQRKLPEAHAILYKMADFKDLDAGISWELANQVKLAQDAERNIAQIQRNINSIETSIDASSRNADMMANEKRREELEQARKFGQMGGGGGSGGQAPTQGGGGNNQNQQPGGMGDGGGMASGGFGGGGGVAGSLRMTQEILKATEGRIKIKMNEVKIENLRSNVRADFAEYINTLFSTGRTFHVLMASEFYRTLFNEGTFPADLAKKVNASLELNKDVDNAVESFRYKISRDEIAGAAQQLQYAFIVNELHPAVAGLERDQKEKIATFAGKLNNLQSLIEARNFGQLEAYVTELAKLAPDFDAAKPRALVDAIKLESKLRLGKARLLAQSGDINKAMEEFRGAAQAWPTNPDLETAASLFFEANDLKTQALKDFDLLAKNEDWRAIFEKQVGFAPALKDDKERAEQFKKALELVKDAEIASEKAKQYMLNSDYAGAWEAVEMASRTWPNDKKLSLMRADLSVKCSEFVSALNRAQLAEEKREHGIGLSWFVQARKIYPASQLANDGIKRLSDRILETQTAVAAAY